MFVDRASRAVVAGDLVAGIGTILIDPVEGDLGDYLDSLAHMRSLEPSVLLPAHGPALPQADAVLAFYIAHRHQRTEQVRQALDRAGRSSPLELARAVYADLPAAVHALGAVQITAHLQWMEAHGLASREGDRWMANG